MLPPEHMGHTKTRGWYKVRWTKNPYPERDEWKGVEGKTDLVMDEDLERYKDFIEIIEAVRADTCVTGLSLRFGAVTEQQVDDWIRMNRK